MKITHWCGGISK